MDALEDELGAVGDVHVERRLGQRGACEVGHDEARVGRAEVGDQDDAGALVEGEDGRRAPAGGGAPAGLVDQLVREQRVQPLGHGRAGQTGPAHEVGARDGLPVADQAE